MTLTEPIRIIVADDHELVRESFINLLAKQPQLNIVGDAGNGEQLVQLVEKLRPHLVLTDLKMPGMDGIRAIREITATNASTKCIALTSFDNEYLVTDALEAGAKGYILKSARSGELMEAIRYVHEGYCYYCMSTSEGVLKNISKSSHNPFTPYTSTLFNDREIKIIRLICREVTSLEISKQLFMGQKNVELLRGKIMKKANVRSVVGLVIYAMRNKIIDFEN